MSFRLKTSTSKKTVISGVKPVLVAAMLMAILAGCVSQGAREAELAAQEAARAAMEQEAARAAQELARQQAEELQRQREAEAAEQARLQAIRDRQEQEARARADAERRQREEAERRERARLAAIAAAEAERKAKLDRIAALQEQIRTLQASTRSDDNASAILSEAVLAAEELLNALTAEQAKYESTDAAGNPTVPLAKDQLAELEARKNELVGRALAQ